MQDMTAAQIATQIATLSGQLVTALETFEGDRAATLRDLSKTVASIATAADILGDQADNSDGPGWDTVVYECGRANHLLGAVSTSLKVAGQGEQDATAALLAPILDQTRGGSRFFDALAALPHSAQLAV